MKRSTWIRTFCFLTVASFCAASAAAADKDAPAIDAKIEQLMHKVADGIERADSLRLSLGLTLNVDFQGVKQQIPSRYSMVLARPNRIALRAQEGINGVTIISDGKQFIRMITPFKKYTVSEAPASFDEIFVESDPAVMVGFNLAGPFLRALCSKDVYGGLSEGVTRARDEGNEKIEGTSCRHLRLKRGDTDWDLWIEDGDRPLVRKCTFDAGKQFAALDDERLKNMKMLIDLTFDEWDLQPKLTDEDFAFSPPEGHEKTADLFGDAAESPEQPHPLLGEPAPAFALEKLSGGKAELAQHRDKDVVILDFWATWCGPCRKALPTLAKVAEKYRDKGVVFYAVDLQEEPDDVRKFLADEKLDITVILDRDGQVGRLYKAEGIPQTVLVGKNGTVQVVHVGLLPDLEKRLSGELDDLLAGKDLAAQQQKAIADQDKASPAGGLELAWSHAGNWAGVTTTPMGEILAVVDRRRLVKLDAKGEEIARNTIDDNPTFLRAANLAGDNQSEVVSFTTWGPTVKAHSAKGELLWAYAKGQGVDNVWAADLTGDGLDETIIGFNGNTGVHVLDNTGNLLWSDASIGNVWHVTAGNTDGDAQPEVVTTSAGGTVHIFSAAGKHLRDMDPKIYGHMVRTWHDVTAEDPYDMILVAGTGEKKEAACGLNDKGVELWRLDLPARVESAATCPRRPWLAIALANRVVQVIDVLSGQVIAQAPDQGPRSDVAWLQVKDQAPLLLVTTGNALRSYRVTALEAGGFKAP